MEYKFKLDAVYIGASTIKDKIASDCPGTSGTLVRYVGLGRVEESTNIEFFKKFAKGLKLWIPTTALSSC